MLRDEDADTDTAAGPASATGVCNVDDDLLMKATRSRRVARPSPATFHTADTGGFLAYYLLLLHLPSVL